MKVCREPRLARRFFDRFEPVHAVTYFSPESRAAFDGLGYRGFWMGYFAGRSAPLGIVPPEVVTATFYNFAASRVAKSLPAAWEVASPGAALRAREDSAVATLRRYGLSDDSVRTAADLASKAARSAPLDGRPLFAANAALPWPTEPLAALWHATTLLREQRGDAHVGVLTSSGLSGRESNVLHAAAGRVPQEMIMRSRDYDEEQWRHYQDRLVQRGLLGSDGALTDAGRELKQHIEDTTDELALSALEALDDHEVEELFRALTPITRAVVAAGDVPAATPMGLSRDDLDDDSAGLVVPRLGHLPACKGERVCSPTRRNSPALCARSRRLVLLFERVGLVDGVTAALVAANFVLRLVLGCAHLPPGRLGVGGDLLLDGALGGAAVALPRHLVALREFLAHAGRLPGVREKMLSRRERAQNVHFLRRVGVADAHARGNRRARHRWLRFHSSHPTPVRPSAVVTVAHARGNWLTRPSVDVSRTGA